MVLARMSFNHVINLFVVGCLVFAAGCGGKDKFLEARPETVAAAGTITYKGEPVEGATILFTPVGHQQGAAGVSDHKGRFWMSTFPPATGVVAGKYDVTISAVEAVVMPELPEGVHAEDVVAPPPKSRIPVKYSDIRKSGLMVEIPAEGNEDLTFNLVD